MSKYALFLGCTTPVKVPQYELASRWVCEYFGIELIDIEEFTCCGINQVNLNIEAGLLMAAMNLALAEAKGLDVLTLCAACTGALAEAVEKLKERQNIILSKETLRKWLIEEGLRSKQRKSNKHRQKRERKRHFGDMVQIDGSHHDWLEGRGPKLVLMGYIDDATNKVYGCFYEYEGTIPAIDSLEKYIRRNGIPMSVYVDQHSTYKTQDRDKWRAISFGKECLSQFERTCKELSITVIHAHSPQAKGRVERLFRTLQDRLVKEFRLSKINTLEQANRFLQVYLKKHNQKFSLQAYNSVNMHRKVKGIKLPRVMCIKTKRRVRNDFTIAHNSTLYQIKSYTPDIDIEVREKIKGRMEIWDKRKSLKYKRIVFKNRIGSLIRN